MDTNPHLDASPSSSTSEIQARALWAFVHERHSRFMLDHAGVVVDKLQLTDSEDPKAVAKRLRPLLLEQGVNLKHTAALVAAAQLLGHRSWHEAQRAEPRHTLKMVRLDGGQEVEFADWSDLGRPLRGICDWFLAAQPARTMSLKFGQYSVVLMADTLIDGNTTPVPLVVINPVEHLTGWLDGAFATLEGLRRYLEESGKCILDGFTVAEFCLGPNPRSGFLPNGPVNATDLPNAELVVEECVAPEESGFEVARGDEVECWAQLEYCFRPDHGPKNVAAAPVVDGDAWQAGNRWYKWRVEVLRPNEYYPIKIDQELTQRDVAALYRRYCLAKRVSPQPLKVSDRPKALEYLGSFDELVHVDQHEISLALSRGGYTWESFTAEQGLDQERADRLPLGVILQLATVLKLDNPNFLFALPNRSALVRGDGQLLHALVPRIDAIRFAIAKDVADEARTAVKEAVKTMREALNVRPLLVGLKGLDQEPTPHLVYASDVDELRATLDSVGVVAYVGVLPHLFPMPETTDPLENSWPFAVGRSLFMWVEQEGAAA